MLAPDREFSIIPVEKFSDFCRAIPSPAFPLLSPSTSSPSYVSCREIICEAPPEFSDPESQSDSKRSHVVVLDDGDAAELFSKKLAAAAARLPKLAPPNDVEDDVFVVEGVRQLDPELDARLGLGRHLAPRLPAPPTPPAARLL